MTGQATPALSRYTVLELGLAESGQYAGRLLADLGARLITIEPLGGIETRSLPPFVHDRHGRRRSVVHEYLNAGKESLAIDLDDGLLGSLLRCLEKRADVLLVGTSWQQSLPKELAIPIVTTSLYGMASGRAHVPSTPFTRFVAGGSGSLMPSRRPTVPGTLAGECFAGAGIAMSVLAMLLTRQRTPEGPAPRVDHCEQAHFVNLEKMFIGRISKEKDSVTRESHRYPFGGAVRCSDGFVSMLINEKHQWKGFCEAIGKPEWATDERFATGSARFRMKDVIEDALHPWCAARTRREVVDAMRSREVPIGSVNAVAEISSDAVLRARGFVDSTETPYGTATVLGLPFGSDPIFSRPSGRRRHAPLLGEHSTAILQELRGRVADDLSALNLSRTEHVDS